ncbi:MAG: hypothetical protein JSU94_13400 [Phycisphaerales bacterium]|nr:MAG: hypothetical protein JSU94_13400 [Phycisphaerales bacterium]
MQSGKPKTALLSAAAATVTAGPVGAKQKKDVDEFIARIKDKSEAVRTEAWLGAGEVGARGIRPLARVMKDDDMEVARAAKRALWRIVRHAGRPGAAKEKQAVAARLTPLLGDKQPAAVRREVLWMLSEIGGVKQIDKIGALLSDKELREDARMVLQRIPGKSSLKVLRAALETAPENFKLNIAQSLRQRGVEVPAPACVKLAPTKKTNVKPIG